jgi:hypothetical protein
VGQAGHVAVLIVVAPGLAAIVAPVIAPIVAAFPTASFVHGNDATHGKANQCHGHGEEDKA